MVHALLVAAAVLFILWLVFFHLGTLVHLVWVGILAALVLWLLGFFFRGRRGRRRPADFVRR